MRIAGVAALLVVCAACGGGSTVDPPTVDAVGTVAGVAYLDVDGSGTLSSGDAAVPGLRVRARPVNGEQTLATDVTDGDGAFRLEGIPVGTVRTEVVPEVLGDSLLEVGSGSLTSTVQAGDTAFATVGISYPRVELDQVRSLPAGRQVFTEGVVLNAPGEAPGGAVHIEAAGRALRVLVLSDVSAAVGDSVRVQGRTTVDLGQTALENARFFPIAGETRAVLPDGVTARDARTADVGRLDADLVELASGSVTRVQDTAEGALLTVEDGTGSVEIRLLAGQGITGGAEVGSGVVRLVGLLVHDPSAFEWRLVPRSVGDVTLEAPTDPPDRRDDDDDDDDDKKGKKGKGGG